MGLVCLEVQVGLGDLLYQRRQNVQVLQVHLEVLLLPVLQLGLPRQSDPVILLLQELQ